MTNYLQGQKDTITRVKGKIVQLYNYKLLRERYTLGSGPKYTTFNYSWLQRKDLFVLSVK